MSITTDLRTALEAAIPDMAPDQAQAARTLVATLAPPMEEPTWPGAPVIATCPGYGHQRLHTRRNDGPAADWECDYNCTSTPWDLLVNPRPLTPAEYAEHRIPMPCTHTTAEETA